MRKIISAIAAATILTAAASSAFAASAAADVTAAPAASQMSATGQMDASTPMTTKGKVVAKTKAVKVSGIVKSVTSKVLTLADGSHYDLPKTFDAKKIKKGDTVDVAFLKVGTKDRKSVV